MGKIGDTHLFYPHVAQTVRLKAYRTTSRVNITVDKICLKARSFVSWMAAIYIFRTVMKTDNVAYNLWKWRVKTVTERLCYTWHALLILVLDWLMEGERQVLIMYQQI